MGDKLVNRGARRNVQLVWVSGFFAGLDRIVGGGSDHGAVVGAKFRFGEENLMSLAKGFLKFGAEGAVGGDAAGK